MGKLLGQAKELIRSLRASAHLGIECPCCGSVTSTKSVVLFTEDERPPKAQQFEDARSQEIQELRDEIKDLKSAKAERLARTTHATNVGQILERFVPILHGFGYDPRDCRALYNPIDYVVFHGAHRGRVSQIEFLDVKSGKARLKPVQQAIRQIVNAGKVSLKIFEAHK